MVKLENTQLKQTNVTRRGRSIDRELRGKREESWKIKWEIMDRAPTFNPVNRKCRLCLKEIYYIMFKPESATLNKRKELFNTCRHRTQKLLSKFK